MKHWVYEFGENHMDHEKIKLLSENAHLLKEKRVDVLVPYFDVGNKKKVGNKN